MFAACAHRSNKEERKTTIRSIVMKLRVDAAVKAITAIAAAGAIVVS